MALQIGAISNKEDYGMYILYGLPPQARLKIYLLKLMQKS
jgi:signal recognition particle receptor subunit beta